MTNQTSDNNKRIAKNTLLYFRMLFKMLVPYVVWKKEEEMR